MTPETSVVITRVWKQCVTMPEHHYWCFYLYGPDGSSRYCGGSWRGTQILAKDDFPGYPIYEAYDHSDLNRDHPPK